MLRDGIAEAMKMVRDDMVFYQYQTEFNLFCEQSKEATNVLSAYSIRQRDDSAVRGKKSFGIVLYSWRFLASLCQRKFAKHFLMASPSAHQTDLTQLTYADRISGQLLIANLFSPLYHVMQIGSVMRSQKQRPAVSQKLLVGKRPSDYLSIHSFW